MTVFYSSKNESLVSARLSCRLYPTASELRHRHCKRRVRGTVRLNNHLSRCAFFLFISYHPPHPLPPHSSRKRFPHFLMTYPRFCKLWLFFTLFVFSCRAQQPGSFQTLGSASVSAMMVRQIPFFRKCLF